MIAWLAIGSLVLLFAAGALTGAPYVPSHRRQVARALDELRPIGSYDLLVDIGSGDGLVLRLAAQRGAASYGIELNPVLVVISRLLSRKYGAKVKVKWGDLYRSKFPDATTVVYVFGDSRDINRMYSKVQAEATRLNRTLDLISYGFEAADAVSVSSAHGFKLYRVSPLQGPKA